MGATARSDDRAPKGMAGPLDGILPSLLVSIIDSLRPEAKEAVGRLLAAISQPEARGLGPSSAAQSTETLLTADQVASRLQINKSTVYKNARRNPQWRQAAVRLGSGTLRFDWTKLAKSVLRTR